MKKYILLVAGLCLGHVALASSTDLQFGVVDIREILQKSPQVERMKQDLQKQFSSRQEQLVKASKTLSADMENLQRNQVVMKPKDRQALEQKISAERDDVQNLQASLQKDFYAAQEKSMHKILADINAEIQKTAQKQHLQFVLPKSSVAYMKSGTPDITEHVKSAVSH